MTSESMEIISPNNVLANAMLRSVDMVRPRLQATKRTFNVDAVVRFGALDNAPYDVRLDPETHHAYQQTYAHALGEEAVSNLIEKYYREMFDSLADATGVDYEVETYSAQHEPSGGYLDLATLYRNLVKERMTARDHVTLSVMVKGGDWAFGCQLVDEAFAQLPGPPPPPRVFTPMVLTDTGAKLSKSLIREGKVPPPSGARPWMLDVTAWDGDTDSYVDALVWLVAKMLADPKHFYRSYTPQELDRIMTTRPATTTGVRAREMNLFRRYFDLVAAGRKTIEVRVRYPNLRKLTAGDHIRFVCGRDDCLTRVKRVTVYDSFEVMLDGEGPANVNPDSPRGQQLASIRRIYGPEKEALGVLAIEIELVN